MVVLFSRGPHLPIDRWVGWTGGWELRRSVSDQTKAAAKAKEMAPDGGEKQQLEP